MNRNSHNGPPSGQPGKWARVAREFSERAPLTGIGEEFLRHTRQFRENFHLKSPFDFEDQPPRE